MRRTAIALAVLLMLAACKQGPTMQLLRDEWVCTHERYVSLNPVLMECIEYRKLR